MGVWSIILPEAGTNKVLSPVAQGAVTTTYATVGTSTITIPTTAGYAYFGYKHYDVVTDADNEGISLVLSALANAIHYVTVRTYGAPTAAWDWNLNGATMNVPTLLGYEGNWYVYGFQFPAAECNGSVALQILTRGVAVNHFVIGHIQVEENTYATTPITGDRKGFTSDGYYWNGTAHASSSTRAAKERSGGKVVDLETTYNFRVRYGEGTGMPPITHHVQSMALLPGALYQGHHVEPRVLDLVSATKANTASTVAAARKNFINAVKMDRVSPEQPVVFRYTAVNSAKPVEFRAYYDSGMEFQTTRGIIDEPVARFICYDPFAYEVHNESAALTTSATVTDADFIARKINGTWYNINTGFDGVVHAIVRGLDGCIYIGGEFTTTGLADHDHYIVKWDPASGTRSVLGTGMNNFVYALAVAPNGDIYAGGEFTSAGGVAETDYIAYWDISAGAWKSVSATHPSAAVRALAFDQSGNLYVGGDFTNLQDGNGDYISRFVFGTGWVSVGTGADGVVNKIAIAPNGDVYATGIFENLGGAAAAGIGKWNGTAWSALGAGLTGGGLHRGAELKFLENGNLIVSGSFTTAGGVACLNIAMWNGKTFEPLGAGVNETIGALAIDDNGQIYAGHNNVTPPWLATPSNLSIWNGTTWAHGDINPPSDSPIQAVLLVNDDLYVGYGHAGNALAAYNNSVTNNGSMSAFPTINIHRAEDGTTAVVTYLKSYTTGDTLWLSYSLLQGETLTIDLTPGERSIKSSIYGDVWRAVLRSSDFSRFRLMPGTNNIGAYVYTTGAPTITAWMEWPLTHYAADGVAA